MDAVRTERPGTNNAQIDEDQRRHEDEMNEARALLSKTTSLPLGREEDVRAALSNYQVKEGLSVTGLLDAATKNRLTQTGSALGRLENEAAHGLESTYQAGAQAVAHGVRSGASAAAGAAKSAVADFSTARVDHLAAGDILELSVTGKVGAEKIESEEKCKLTVKCESSSSYTVEASGEYSAKGASAISAGGSGVIKLTASSKEEAKRLVAILERAALQGVSTFAAMELLRAANQGQAGAVSGDLAFVLDHLKAVTLTGDAAVKVKASLGERTDGADVGIGPGVTGAASASFSNKVTLELDHGVVKGFDVETTFKAQVSAKAAADAKLGNFSKGSASSFSLGNRLLGVNIDGTLTATVTVKHHFSVPATLTPAEQQMDPTTLARSLAPKMLKDREDSIVATCEGAVSAGPGAHQNGRSAKVTLTLTHVGANAVSVGRLLEGDFEGALAASGQAAKSVTLNAEEYADEITNYGGTVGDKDAVELGVDTQAKDRHRIFVAPPIVGTPSEVFMQLENAHKERVTLSAQHFGSVAC